VDEPNWTSHFRRVVDYIVRILQRTAVFEAASGLCAVGRGHLSNQKLEAFMFVSDMVDPFGCIIRNDDCTQKFGA
jgi:hypothetical protein